jgi:hypothetical protein
MKKYFSILALICCWACSDDAETEQPAPPQEARTQIPDANFEAALVAQDLDDVVDGSVRTAAIEFITDLNLDDSEIEDLSGIGDFKALVNLSLRNNDLSSLDVSNNTSLLFVWAENNQISTLRIGTNPDIEKIGMSGNQIQTLVVTDYTQLQLLTLDDNRLEGLDVSTCSNLNTLAVEGNPLECILVSPAQLEAIPPNWTKDQADSYSLDCL